MAPLDDDPVLQKGLRTAQIIVGALLLGVLVFTGILFWMHQNGKLPLAGESSPTLSPILDWIFALGAVVQAVVFLFLRSTLLARAGKRVREAPPAGAGLPSPYREAGVAGRLFTAWMTATIIGAAGVEGSALLCLVGFLIGGQPILLLVAAAFAFVLAMQMPSRRNLNAWLEAEQAKLEASPAAS